VKRITLTTMGISLPAVAAVMLAATMVQAADDAMSSRIADYYRRKSNLPPEVAINVTDVKDSKIKGAKSATLELNRGGQSQKVDIVMSPDGQYVVFGSVEDVTSDPFAEIVKKINLKGEPMKGGKNAKVTIVEYSDFQCPYCARAHDTIENQVLKEYGDKVRLVHKNFPLAFHKWAEPAAIAAECAFDQNADAYWKVYNYMYKNQSSVTPENVKEKSLESLGDTKIDKAKFDDCYDNKKTLDRVKADMTEGQQVGVSGTPAFLINGRKISGAQPFQNFKAVIDDELQRAGDKS
jgi:protein-disulfide isomerase